MFKEWLDQHPVETLDLSTPLWPPAKDRTFWSDKTKAKHVTEGEQYLNYTWPQAYATDFMAYHGEGNRIKQEKPHFARRRALLSLLIGELAEYRGRFLPDIVNGIFAICEETYWGLSAHYKDKKELYHIPDAQYPYIDLFAAETASLLAGVYYLLYKELHAFCPEILSRLEYEMDRRIVSPYLDHLDAWWMGEIPHTINNWTPWILSNLLTVFLLMEPRKGVFEKGMKKMFREMDVYYNIYPTDGGCDEGCCYWSVAGGTLFEFCDQLYVASNGAINFFNDEKIVNTGKYIRRVYIGDHYFVNFADGTPKQTHALSGMLYLYGKRIGDEEMMNLAQEFLLKEKKEPHLQRDSKLKRNLAEIIYEDEIRSRPAFKGQENVALYSIENAFARKGDWHYAAKGGHNRESHNHNDVGSFIVYHQNKPLLIDPSCGTYTAQTFSARRYEIWCMQSHWHNLPLINGTAQEHGREFHSDAFTFDGNTAKISFASAYPEQAGVQDVTRLIQLKEQGITVTDSFVFAKDQNEIQSRFITPLPCKAEKNGVLLGDHFLLTCDKEGAITLDCVEFSDDSKLTLAWGQEHLNRITFHHSCGKESQLHFELTEIK